MSSFLLLRAVSRTSCSSYWVIFEMGCKWPYSCCFVGCCFQDLFNITRSILVQFPSSFFSMSFVSVHVVHRQSSTDTTDTRKKSRFHILNRLGYLGESWRSEEMYSTTVLSWWENLESSKNIAKFLVSLRDYYQYE